MKSWIRLLLGMVMLMVVITSNAQTNRVLLLDGTNDYLAINNLVTNSFTLELWINLQANGVVDASPGLGTPLFSAVATSHPNWWNFRLDGNYPTLNIEAAKAQSTVPLPLGSWTHVAATRDMNTHNVLIYVNGVLLGQATDGFGTLNNQPYIWIGRSNWGAYITDERWLSAYVDECRFWNRALSQSEIQSNMFVVLTGSEPGLVTYLNFDGNNFNDTSGSGNNATASGSPAIVLTNSFVGSPVIHGTTLGSVMGMQFTTAPSQWYSLQYNSNIAASNWVDAGMRVKGDGGTRWFFDPAGFSPLKFYRVEIAPLYDTVRVAGTFSGWGGFYYLDRIAPNTWQGSVTMTNQTGVQFKFLANDSWSTSWGEDNQTDLTLPISGDAEFNTTSNIFINGTLTGTYRFTFDDQYGNYTVEQVIP